MRPEDEWRDPWIGFSESRTLLVRIEIQEFCDQIPVQLDALPSSDQLGPI
jgi:hypothetical protein